MEFDYISYSRKDPGVFYALDVNLTQLMILQSLVRAEITRVRDSAELDELHNILLVNQRVK